MDYQQVYVEIVSFGNCATLVCQCVILTKWFRNQFSMAMVFGLLFTLTPPIILGVLLLMWQHYLIPNKMTYVGTFDYAGFEKVEFILYCVSYGAIFLCMLIDSCAGYQKNKMIKKMNTTIQQRESALLPADNHIASENRSTGWLESDEDLSQSLCSGLRTLESPYYLMIFTIACLNVSFDGMQKTAGSYFVFKYGFDETIWMIDQTPLALT